MGVGESSVSFSTARHRAGTQGCPFSTKVFYRAVSSISNKNLAFFPSNISPWIYFKSNGDRKQTGQCLNINQVKSLFQTKKWKLINMAIFFFFAILSSSTTRGTQSVLRLLFCSWERQFTTCLENDYSICLDFYTKLELPCTKKLTYCHYNYAVSLLVWPILRAISMTLPIRMYQKLNIIYIRLLKYNSFNYKFSHSEQKS